MVGRLQFCQTSSASRTVFRRVGKQGLRSLANVCLGNVGTKLGYEPQHLLVVRIRMLLVEAENPGDHIVQYGLCSIRRPTFFCQDESEFVDMRLKLSLPFGIHNL